eukprot:76936_1
MDTDPNEASDKPLWTTPSGTNVYQIFVECPDGTIETLNVQDDNPIDYVKLQIETITNQKYVVKKQKLFFEKKELRDTQTLSDASILKNNTLQLSFDRISIYVETQQGKIIQLMVAPDDSIAHVKQTIEQRTGGIGKGYAVKDQALFNRLNDEELIDNDAMIFLDYGLIHNSSLYVTGVQINIDEESNDSMDMSEDSDDSDDAIIDTLLGRQTNTRPRPRRAQTLCVSKSTQSAMRQAHRSNDSHDSSDTDSESESTDSPLDMDDSDDEDVPTKKKLKPIVSLETDDHIDDEPIDVVVVTTHEELKRKRKKKPKKRKKKQNESDEDMMMFMDSDEDEQDEELQKEAKRRRKKKPKKRKKKRISSMDSDDTICLMDSDDEELDELDERVQKMPKKLKKSHLEDERKRRKKKKPKKKKTKKMNHFEIFSDEERTIQNLLHQLHEEDQKSALDRPQSARVYPSRQSRHKSRERAASKSKKRNKSKKRSNKESENKFADFLADVAADNKRAKPKRPVSASSHTMSFFGGPNASVMDKINAAHSNKRRVSTLQRPATSRNIRSRSFIANPIGIDPKTFFGVNSTTKHSTNKMQITVQDPAAAAAKDGKRRIPRPRAHTLCVSKSAQTVMRETTHSDNWIITTQNRESEFEMMWSKMQKLRNGKVNGKIMKPFMEKSGLSKGYLGKIWSLSEVDKDGKMGFEEFAICCYLIEETKKGHKLPQKLPPHYVPPSLRGVVFERSSSKRSRSTSKSTHLRPTIDPSLMNSQSAQSASKSLQSMHNAAAPALVTSKSANTDRLQLHLNNNSSNNSYISMCSSVSSSSSSSSSDLDPEPQPLSPDEIQKEQQKEEEDNDDSDDDSSSSAVSEFDRQQFAAKKQKQLEFLSAFWSDSSEDESENKTKTETRAPAPAPTPPPRSRRAQTFTISKSKQLEMKQQQQRKKSQTVKKEKMRLRELLRICHIKTSNNSSVYSYYFHTLHIEYARDMVDHAPKSITQPPAFRSTKTRMLLNKMSKFVTSRVLEGEWDGRYAQEWKELAHNRVSQVYGQAPMMALRRKEEEDESAQFIRSESIYFCNELNAKVNCVDLKGNDECFVNKKIYCNTTCVITVTLEAMPIPPVSAHSDIVQIGCAFYDREHAQYDSVYISDRCGIYRNDAFLTMLSLSNSRLMETQSQISIHCGVQRTESIIKFEHSKNGKLYDYNAREISLDILQYTGHYCKLFIRQFYGNGSYKIHQMIPNPKMLPDHQKKKKQKKKKKPKKNKKHHTNNQSSNKSKRRQSF